MRILYMKGKNILKFAEACLTLSPKVSLLEEEELYIDISPTLSFFQGEANWITKFENLKNAFSIHYSYLINDRIEWAKAFAVTLNTLNESFIIPPGRSVGMIHQLPIERLIAVGHPELLSAQSQERKYLVSFMRRVGLNQVADFLKLDTTAISRRFGKMGLEIHQWLREPSNIVLPVYKPFAPIQEFIDAEEIGSTESLIQATKLAFERMILRLEAREQAAKTIKFSFYFDGAQTEHQFFKLHEPHRELKRFLELFQNFLNKKQWAHPLKFLELEIIESSAFIKGQLSLIEQTENKMADLGHYVQELRSRLGSDSVGFAELLECYVPERAWQKVWPPPKKLPPTRPFLGLRPPLLYQPPRPYVPHKDQRLLPTESIATHWWEEQSTHRKYFIAQSQQGKRFWIFWDCLKESWFLQGAFD